MFFFLSIKCHSKFGNLILLVQYRFLLVFPPLHHFHGVVPSNPHTQKSNHDVELGHLKFGNLIFLVHNFFLVDLPPLHHFHGVVPSDPHTQEGNDDVKLVGVTQRALRGVVDDESQRLPQPVVAEGGL